MSDDGEGVRRDCHIQVQQQQPEVMSMNAVSFNPSVIFS